MAQQLLTAVGLREHDPANRTQHTELRKRAFTLVVTVYDELRSRRHLLAVLRPENCSEPAK